ncbi:hypothetical protein L1987_15925 [Smallanthus sonchifolius]|uniref:Uncharacterized protein n=1 Tax=Smallanthus sonchifolius TaxID=185202 RepID=A0ACB9J7A1_9ASTR|nr:hypothetical protein L1987_15925 [Smallanthus sonchifolius]
MKSSIFDDIHQVFNYFDENGDGKISASELQNRLRKVGGEELQLYDEEAEMAVRSSNADGDGVLGGKDDVVQTIGYSSGWFDILTSVSNTAIHQSTVRRRQPIHKISIVNMLWWWSTLFLLSIHGSQAQQTYVDNRQLDCNNNYTTTFGYTCNGPPSCRSYLTFRSQPPRYNTPSSIAALLNSNPNDITTLNNFSSNSATIPTDTIVVVPISNCSCSGEWYQHNASYELQGTNETYFSVANNTYEGLSTCQAMITQNTYNFRNLAVGNNITVPLRCACPTANQTAAGIRYLLTYLITWGNNYEYMSTLFAGVDVQSILLANSLSQDHIIFPFTPILIPLRTEPTRINNSATPAPPPAPPVIPVTPTTGGGGGSSSKWTWPASESASVCS